MTTSDDRVLLGARAQVLADLVARTMATPEAVDILDAACAERRWWLEQWAEGADYVAGLVAQDVQEALADRFGRAEAAGRWPECRLCTTGPVHVLHVDPDLGGPDPTWVCEESGRTVAALGSLGAS